MSLLKLVLVKISIFMLMKKALDVKQYITNCVNMGSVASLYMNPAIPTAFYTSMTAAATAIQTAIDVANLAPTKGNKKLIRDAMNEGKLILVAYAKQVQAIANLPANAPTRDVAATNIELSFLTPQKLSPSKKGDPATPTFTALNIGTSKVEIEVTNGVSYNPTSIVVIAIEQPAVTVPATAEPDISLVRGQIEIQTYSPTHVVTVTMQGKAASVIFDTLKSGINYKIYAYAKNGKKQISVLSVGVLVKG